MSPYLWLTDGVGYYAGHYCAYEADAQDYYDFLALGAVLGDEGLDALDFSGFVLRGGQGELFAVGGDILSVANLGRRNSTYPRLSAEKKGLT